MNSTIRKVSNKNEWIVGDKFIVKPSRRKNKKYDVFSKETDKYILSFGDSTMQQYFDKFGYYSKLNHLDEKRKQSYQARSRGIGNLNNNYSSNYWSYHFLWA